MKYKSTTVFILLMLCFYYSNAQDYLWLNTAGSVSGTNNPTMSVKNCRDDSNNYYVLTTVLSDTISRFFTNGITKDSGIFINPNYLFGQPNAQYSSFILKYNVNGIFQWAKKCHTSGSFRATDMQYNNQKLFISGDIGGVVSINGQTYYDTLGQILLASYDMSGNLLTSLQFPELIYSDGSIGDIINDPKIRVADSNTVYILYTFRLINGSSSTYLGYYFKKIVANNIVWEEMFSSDNRSSSTNCFRINDFDILNGSVYFIGEFMNNYNILGQMPIYSNGKDKMVIFKSDTAGNITWAKTYGNNNYVWGSMIKGNKNNLFIDCRFTNGNLQIDSFNIKLIGTNANEAFALLDTSGKAIWVNHSGTVKGNSQTIGIDISNKGYYYIYGTTNSANIYFDNFLIQNSQNSTSDFIGKLDSRGKFNYLILANSTSGFSVANTSVTDTSGDIIVSGFYNNGIKFGNLNSTAHGQSENAFTLKIQDISITKGLVLNHPYCSGDSIFVPYTIIGQFRAGNHFTAQLSDRYGNFDSVFYNLGFVTDTLGGIIKGKLPDTLFTSNKYSIRIVADSPTVISFSDSINYFITQMPLAHAGKDTLICFGQSIHINDSSSSAIQYHWKPFSFMNDSTIKFPLVKPDTSITYFLTAQSNNCFAYDTVLVNVRKPLSFASLHDTVFCKNDTLQLQPILIGGDSLHRILNLFKLSDTLSFATNDSLMRIRFIPDSSHVYRVTLSDGCSIPFSDTFNLRLRVPLNLTVSSDTLVCRGLPLQLSVNGWQSDSAAYKLNWSYKRNVTQFLSLTDSSFYKIISDSSMKFLLQSHYVCVNKIDSYFVNLKVLPRLQLKLNSDSTICFGQTIPVTAIASGGDTLHYRFNWKNLNNNTGFVDTNYSNNFSVSHNFKPHQTVTYQLKLNDGCTVPIDSSQIKITVRDSLQINISGIKSFCERDSVSLFVSHTGGIKNQYKFVWNKFNDTTILSNDTSLFISNVHDSLYHFNFSDGCSLPVDTMLNLHVKPAPIAKFSLQPTTVCEFDPIYFYDSSVVKDIVQYQWTFANGNLPTGQAGLFSTMRNPIYVFTTSGKFDIKLNIIQSNGCTDSFTIKNAVLIKPKPIADFTASSFTTDIYNPYFHFTTLSGDTLKHQWIFGNTGLTSSSFYPDITFRDTGSYLITLIVQNLEGCTDTANKWVRVNDINTLFIPNSFTPNDDGLNDIFKPVGRSVKEFRMYIIDRGGNIIFETNDIYNGWNGRISNTNNFETGNVFVYKILTTDMNNQKHEYNGTVTMLK